MRSLLEAFLAISVIALFVFACVAIAREEVIPYDVGDYIKYRLDLKMIRADREIVCRWIIEAKITDISYPYVYLNLTWSLEHGDPEQCGSEQGSSIIRCRIDITPEDVTFTHYWEWPILIDPEYSQRYRIKSGALYEEMLEYKKGVLVSRFSRIPNPFGVDESSLTLIETSIDIDRPSILWLLTLASAGAVLSFIMLWIARRKTVKASAPPQ